MVFFYICKSFQNNSIFKHSLPTDLTQVSTNSALSCFFSYFVQCIYMAYNPITPCIMHRNTKPKKHTCKIPYVAFVLWCWFLRLTETSSCNRCILASNDSSHWLVYPRLLSFCHIFKPLIVCFLFLLKYVLLTTTWV